MRANFDPALLNVAFVFLFLGYGTKVGLAPLHAWLPDAHAEGPTPISAVLSGLLLNVALYALLRFKILLAASPAAIAPGPLMVTMGLVSLVFAAFMLYRRRDIKRLFAYSSIEHMGIIVFAFGMGGPLANFAGLLHMVMHSLTKSAIFYAVGHISQIKGTQRISRIRGLTVTHPALGWGLVVGVVAIAGLPPLGIFMSEFLVVSSTFARQPLLAIVLVFGLLLAFGALTAAPDQRRVRQTPRQHGVRPRLPMYRCLPISHWCWARESIFPRRLSSGSSMWQAFLDSARKIGHAIADRSHARGPPGPATRPWPRAVVDAPVWNFAAERTGTWPLEPARSLGRTLTVHMAIMDGQTAEIAIVSLDCPDRPYPSVGQHHPPAFRLERTITTCSDLSAEGPPDNTPLARPRPMGLAFPLGGSHRCPAASVALSLPAGGRRRPAPDCGRSGACRHH